MSPKKLTLIILLATISLIAESIYTVQLTIYPKTAQEKNATSFEYAFVFASFDAAVAVISPFVGSLMSLLQMGSKRTLIVSLIIEGFSLFLFGFVDKINDLCLFLGASVFLRILEGVGIGFIFVTIYGLIPVEFPGRLGTVFLGVLEALVPVGFFIGPLIGTTFSSFGGFIAPFSFVGCLFLLAAPAVQIFVSKTKPIEEVENQNEERNLSPLKSFNGMGNFISIFFSSTVVHLLYVLLEPYLRIQFNTSPYMIGVVFGVCGLLYSIFSFIGSILIAGIEKGGKFYDYIILFGHLAQLGGNVFLVDFGIQPTFTTIFVGISLLSLGTGLSIFVSFLQAQNNLKVLYGGSESYTVIASAGYISAIKFGGLAGPLIGGLLTDLFGFEKAAYFTLIVIIGLIVSKSVSTTVEKVKSSRTETNIDGTGFDLVACNPVKFS